MLLSSYLSSKPTFPAVFWVQPLDMRLLKYRSFLPSNLIDLGILYLLCEHYVTFISSTKFCFETKWYIETVFQRSLPEFQVILHRAGREIASLHLTVGNSMRLTPLGR